MDVLAQVIAHDMASKADERLLVLDPTRDEPHTVLKDLVDNFYINDPASHFRVDLNDIAKAKIESQMRKHFYSIEKSIARQDFDLALFKLNELIELKSLIEQDFADEIYDAHVEKLMSYLNAKNNVCIVALNGAIERNELINAACRSEYVSCWEQVNESECILKKLGDKNGRLADELTENLLTITY